MVLPTITDTAEADSLDIDLVLEDLESNLSSEAYNHLLSLVENERGRLQSETSVARQLTLSSTSASELARLTPALTLTSVSALSRLPRTLSRLQMAVEQDIESGSFLGTTGTGFFRVRVRAASSNCSHSVVCRKIISKVEDKKLPSRNRSLRRTASRSSFGPSTTTTSRSPLPPSLSHMPSSSSSSRFSTYSSTPSNNRVETPLLPITGKIDDPTIQHQLRARPSKGSKAQTPAAIPACDFSKPVSNPLYKSYSPRGYIKSDNEQILEKVEELVTEFRNWVIRVGTDTSDNGAPSKGLLESGQDARIMEMVTASDLFGIIRCGMELP